jgi:penicillin-binding protein 1A
MKFVLVLISLGFIGGMFVLGLIIYISFDLPQINSLSDYNPPVPSRIYSKDGELLLELAKERRDIVSFDEIPPRIVNSFLAAEDDNFFNHSGVDYTGIARAMFKNIKAGRIVQGASTITQQVAKSLLLSSERTYTRKIKDLLLAKRIEDKFSKEDILFLYLNQVYLGGGYYGVKTAFKGYFGKKLEEATIAESALIAGLLVAPGKYSPYVNPNYAKTRQKYVLSRMFKTQKITQVEYQDALKENIKMNLRESNEMKAGYFTDWIRQRLMDQFGKDDFMSNGYEVVTTINWELQKKAEEEVLKGVIAIDKRQGYKGPLGFIDSLEAKINLFEKQRKEIYKENSTYFTFLSDGTVKKEREAVEGEVAQILTKQSARVDEIKASWRRNFETGVDAEDKFNDLIRIGKNYKAIVTKVVNSQRMVYVQFAGGAKGMIPYEYFRWAHERVVSEERNYWSYVTRPSSILKPGDVVLIKTIRKPRSAWKSIHTDFKKKKLPDALLKLIKNEKFYLVSLEQEPQAQGALLSISPSSGEIISMVGGSDFKKSQFNRAVQSNRQPGSAFKPLIFAVGLENGYNSASILLDSPSALGGADASLSWKPRNYDGKFKGQMTYRRALETSRNIPTIRLTQDIGVSNIISFVDRLKLKLDLPKDLSVSLGSFGINLLDLVKTYAIFPSGGRPIRIKSVLSIKDRFGKVHQYQEANTDKQEVDQTVVISEQKKDETKIIPDKINPVEAEKVEEVQNPFLVNLNDEQIYDQRLAYIMSNLLKGVVQNGTGRGARDISSFIGGKTGTTNNYVDAWFLGFSSKIVTGVWTGFDNNKTLGWGETGAKSALPIWKEYMRLGIKRFGESDFSIPSGILNLAINKETGKPVKSMGSGVIMEAFVEGTEPGNDILKPGNEEQDLSDSILEDEDYYNNQ